MEWQVTTPPVGTVLTWQQLKSHIHPASSSEQSYIMDLLASATSYAETMLQSCLLPQTITATYDAQDIPHRWEFREDYINGWHHQRLELPRGPIIQIDDVIDDNGNDIPYVRHTAGNAEYIVPLIELNNSQLPITVVYQAGHGNPGGSQDSGSGSAVTIPADILSAIRVHVATMYMVRESVTNLAANPVHKLDDFYRFKGRQSLIA
jgi:hypothetical protein